MDSETDWKPAECPLSESSDQVYNIHLETSHLTTHTRVTQVLGQDCLTSDNKAKSTFSTFSDDTKFGGDIATPESFTAIQRDFNRLEKLATGNIFKFRGKCEVLQLLRNNLSH